MLLFTVMSMVVTYHVSAFNRSSIYDIFLKQQINKLPDRHLMTFMSSFYVMLSIAKECAVVPFAEIYRHLQILRKSPNCLFGACLISC